MADPNMNKNQNQSNETMQGEQAKASVAGGRTPEQGKSDEDRREQGRIDKEGREKSAIGGGEKGQGMGQSSQGSSQTGEPGRSRSELDQGRESDKSRESDKGRSEPTSR
ncbi:hypothetical protein [Sphingomonas sp.]|jgi:hypothetical protein|uniref:hypothetical protein n=1 Tax=Sphingomonas sp. TaxID=28214 RepID=UPI0017A768AC|nr:hypothetical protein [Sphingomonas sp.]MBA3511294.1 hypothetical protein [Sphingomonas sp.]